MLGDKEYTINLKDVFNRQYKQIIEYTTCFWGYQQAENLAAEIKC